MRTGSGPLIPRRLLGTALRGLREQAGEQLQDTARTLGFSTSKLSRIETGRLEPQDGDLQRLIDHFGVDATPVARRLHGWAEAAAVPGWWQELGVGMPHRLDTFIGYESAAAEIRSHEQVVLPGLLQTRDYARAVLTDLTETDAIDTPAIEAHVEIRMLRQQHVLGGPAPARLQVAFPESVMARTVGSDAIMNAQLDALAAASEQPHVTVHVVPNSAGLYRALEGGFTIFGYAEPELPDVVNTESVLGSQFVIDEASVAKHRRLFDDLARKWLDPPRSRDLIISYRR